MGRKSGNLNHENFPRLKNLTFPAKILVTILIISLGVAMAGALAQIIVHDILPTFFDKPEKAIPIKSNDEVKITTMVRGDLFDELDVKKAEPEKKRFYQEDQFIWALKWTHIHLFGMSMIFIFMGGVSLLLDLNDKTRSWLIILPFAGILIDIAALWLKAYVSPLLFWLHIPGGNLFTGIFIFVALRAFWEMWGKQNEL